MIEAENFEQVEVTSAQQLRSWLKENHSQRESIWLVTYKNMWATNTSIIPTQRNYNAGLLFS